MLLLKADPLADRLLFPVNKTDFEHRATEMKARNLANRQYRPVPPPPSIFAKPSPLRQPQKVSIRDFVRFADIDRLISHMAPAKKLGHLETDRDGLLNLKPAGLSILVSPELLLRALEAYDAVLQGTVERGWPITKEENNLRVLVSDEPLEIDLSEKTDAVPGVAVRPGERRPRRPAGALVITLTAGYRKTTVSDKRGTKIESKLPDLFLKAEALASEVHAEREERAAIARQEQLVYKRRIELAARLERLDKNLAAWERAARIRAYVRAVEETWSSRAPIEPGSDQAKWLKWAREHADGIDPTCGSLIVAPQEFWE